jgi:hypothetical protein
MVSVSQKDAKKVELSCALFTYKTPLSSIHSIKTDYMASVAIKKL